MENVKTTNEAEEAKRAEARDSIGETTQLTPDDQLSDGGAMPPEREGEGTSWRKVEQDTVAVNPSAESMDSRG
ncbi:MAG: hypothetical protein J1E04_06875 [Alistipes sp.]|nr:hypothetical protein [Alistipes sp.]